MQSPWESSPVVVGGGGELIQSQMLASFSMHPNVAKQLELSWDYCWWQRASASEIVDSFIWDFVKTFDVQHDPIALEVAEAFNLVSYPCLWWSSMFDSHTVEWKDMLL